MIATIWPCNPLYQATAAVACNTQQTGRWAEGRVGTRSRVRVGNLCCKATVQQVVLPVVVDLFWPS